MSIISQSWIKKRMYGIDLTLKVLTIYTNTHTQEGGKEEIIRGDGQFMVLFMVTISQVYT